MKPHYLDLPTVAATVSLSEASIQQLVRENRFPRPRMLSGRRVAWFMREVEAKHGLRNVPCRTCALLRTQAIATDVAKLLFRSSDTEALTHREIVKGV